MERLGSVVRRGHGGKLDVAELQVGRHAEVGCGSVAFGEEEAQFVLLAILQSQSVQVHGLLLGAVHPAEIDHQFAVDVDPHVVVTTEGEHLGAVRLLGELGLEFEREVVVVIRTRPTGIAEELVVDREETAPLDALGVGVRIEDDVLVTKGGCHVLTSGVPKDADDIEALMAAL